MKATLRLVLTYFAATPLMRGLALTGFAFIAYGFVAVQLLAPADLTAALRGNWSGTLPFFAIFLPWVGMVLLLAATTLMPAIAERIALGRSVWLLPGGRIKLLASVLLTGTLLAFVFAAAAATAFSVFFPWDTTAAMFSRTFVMTLVDLGMLYTAVWLTSKTQGIWRLVGTLVAIVAITVPLRLIDRGQPFSWIEWLGITRPWLIALGQVAPVAIMTFVIRYSESWLAIMMILSAMSGAVTSQAAARSRRFWLRVDHTRAEIARQVETAFWRFNVCSLLVLSLLFGLIGVYSGFSASQILHGWLLFALGCAVFTYLGLMITRGLGWFESIVCILSFSTLVIAAIATMRFEYALVVRLEIVLAVAAVVFRYVAVSRWTALDWMRCRSELALPRASA